MDNYGIVVINKEKDFTSHDVVAVVKRTLKIKAGHTGTLDPQAEGVLPVCLGKATRLTSLLTAEDKTYIAEVVLGITTDTADNTGTVVNTAPVDFDEDKIRGVVFAFVGRQMQTPPMYSAIKINGQKLYELARKGEIVERVPREVFIKSVSILSFNREEKKFTIEVDCSKGTYIRSLCDDIGRALGCGACMGDLLRTRSGVFTLDKSVKLKELCESDVLSLEEVLPYPRVYAMTAVESRVLNGNPINIAHAEFEQGTGVKDKSDKCWLYSSGKLIGLYKASGMFLTPEVRLI